ncbi:C1 family peptidase [Streptomyces sp. H10-C2]|uniref:C1 family peptidase n=1 Tax=unclassified Streptomyces TaxID=2593676 RepID=UPI0024BB1649|nr:MULTISPECIES: C1 family peptidase [unclassified Streptomyces]MDJ0341060.1 C1 family peptidase [Streptomyces sp. PH10-H1]MDJ0369708.1 C1 family peptidase [Streptomyces sp. H10-C2]
MASTTPRTIARFGWVPDLPDARDHIYSLPRLALVSSPPRTDLRGSLPPVYNQGRIGSCTANAIAGAFEFELMRQQLPATTPSRLFIYYNERAVEGHVGTDSGAQIRDGIKSVATLGVCPETEWPYDDTPAVSDGGPFPSGARAGKKPAAGCYKDALLSTATAYQRIVQDLDQLKGCLAAGFPFVFGFTVYSSFESPEVAKTGDAPLPASDDQVLGGHAVLAAGYDDTTQRFLVRNSWGPDWGQDGYFTLPYAYLTERGLSSDFWTLRLVT